MKQRDVWTPAVTSTPVPASTHALFASGVSHPSWLGLFFTQLSAGGEAPGGTTILEEGWEGGWQGGDLTERGDEKGGVPVPGGGTPLVEIFGSDTGVSAGFWGAAGGALSLGAGGRGEVEGTGGAFTLAASLRFGTGGGTPGFADRGSQGPCTSLRTAGAGTALEGRGTEAETGGAPSVAACKCCG